MDGIMEALEYELRKFARYRRDGMDLEMTFFLLI